jgi:cell division transport system permease protein
MIIQLWRVLVAGTRNFIRNAWLSTAATAVMTITLSIIVVSFISNSTLTSTIKGVTDKIDVAIHLKPDVTADQVKSLTTALSSDPDIESVVYRTKEQVVADFKKTQPAYTDALSNTGNPLDPEIQVKAKDPTKLSSIIAIVNLPANKVLLDPDPKAAPSYSGEHKDSIDKIIRVSGFLKLVGFIASILFVVVSTLIIFAWLSSRAAMRSRS